MATKEEIIAAIQQGIARVEGTFGTLTDEQLATRVHSEESGWTARDILAHLAGRGPGYDLFIRMAEGGPMPQGMGGFDVNAWNRARVEERGGESRDELLAEFRAVHEGLIARAREMPDEVLQRTIPTPRGEVALGDIMRQSGGVHSVNHTIEVERALGLAAPGA